MSTKKTKNTTRISAIKNEEVKKVETSNNKFVSSTTTFFKNNYQTMFIFATGLIVGLGVMFIIGYGNIAKLENGKEIVVSIDGLKITANDLYADLKEQNGLNNLLTEIDEFILNKEYKDKTADAKKYADDYVASLKTQYKDNWTDFLAYYGFADETALNESLKTQYFANLTTEDYVETLITTKEIEEYYNTQIVGDTKVSHILIKADYAEDATEAEIKTAKEKALATAKNLIKQLNESSKPAELFVKLAKENSDDTSNASKGGDLGYFNKGQMQASFETAAYKLTNINEYTKEPVETTYGYHIIIKTAKNKDKATLEASKTKIISDLVASKTTADPSLAIKAKMNLRDEFKIKFEEEKMKKAYTTLMDKQIADAKKPATQS